MKEKKYTIKMVVQDLWRFVHPYKFRFFAATAIRLISDLVWLYPSIALASIVTIIASGSENYERRIAMIFLLWCGATVVRIVGQFIAKYLINHVAEKVKLDIEESLLTRVSMLPASWHEAEHSGNRMKRIQRGAEASCTMIKMWVNNAIEITVNMIGMPFILYQFHPYIGIATFVFMGFFFFVSKSLARPAIAAVREVSRAEEDMQGLVFEMLNNMRTVKVLGMSKSILSRLKSAIEETYRHIHRRIFCYQRKNTVLGLLSYGFRLFMVACIVYGVVVWKAFPIGFIVLFYNYYNRMWEAITELTETSEVYGISKYNFGRAMSIFYEPLAPDCVRKLQPFPSSWSAIHFDNVRFCYGDVCALSGLSFTVRRGEKIAIVGSSGAGKSTLFKILLKEVHDYEGVVRFDDMPLSEIDTDSYTRRAAVVLQDTEVFHFSLRDNITLVDLQGKEDAKRLDRALEVSHVNGFLSKLPQGLDTLIGEKGVRLSGGERQRLGIARAVYASPDIFFLDEATSHLDLESEEYIRDSLGKVFVGVTAFVIAHRLTTIQQMDRILVLEQGSIVEEGTFTELMEKRGRFFDLWEKQNL